MAESIQWILHRGNRILENDLSNLGPEEFTAQMKKFEKLVLGQDQKDICVFSDIRGTTFDRHSMTELKRIASSTKPYIIKYAVIGVSGMKRVLFSAVKPFATAELKAIDSVEEAKDWLVSS